MLLAPALTMTTVLIVIPAASGVYHAFTLWTPGYASPWVGLDNFRELFASDIFRQILRNQAFLLLLVPCSMAVALLLSLLLYDAPGARLFRLGFFLPAMLPPAVAGIAFVYLLAPEGPFNSALRAVGLDGLTKSWLIDPDFVKPTLVIILTWSTVGTGVAILSASLASIPPDLFEAARMDGAGWWKVNWHIARPLLKPALEMYGVIQVIQVFLWSFPWIYVLTSGGPGYSSTTIDWDVYTNTLRFGKFGLGAAEAVVILVIVGLVSLVGVRLGRGRAG